MTRIALISDLHGNAMALDAVLRDIARRGVDRTVCLGDVATLGPRPLEVLEHLQRSGCDSILGNHDEFMLQPELVNEYTKFQILRDAVAWCRDRLPRDAIEFIRGFLPSLELSLGGAQTLLLFHGTPDSNATDLLATTPPDTVDEMLGERRATVMAGGHTHVQMLRQHRGCLLVNPGSLGMPFKEYVGGGPPTVLPHAEYAIVNGGPQGVSVELLRVALDKHALREAALAVDNPICASLAQSYA